MTTDLLILQALRHSTLTEELRDAEIDALAKLITVRDFKTGDILVQPSESADLKDTLLILGSGEVEADAVVGNDNVKLHMLKPGDLAGIIGFVGGSATQASATVVAKTDGKMLLLDRMRFETLLNTQPAIVPGRQGAEFEIGQRYLASLAPRRFDTREGGAQRVVADRLAVQADPFVIGQQVWRGITTDPVAGAGDYVFQVGAGRALAVGATDDDDRAMLDLPERRLDPPDALQPELDAGLPLGVQAFKVLQPVFQMVSSGGRQLLQKCQNASHLIAQFAAIDDHVDGSLFEQEFGTLKSFRQGFTYRLLDDARPGETDQRLGFGDDHVADEGERRRNATHGRIGKNGNAYPLVSVFEQLGIRERVAHPVALERGIVAGVRESESRHFITTRLEYGVFVPDPLIPFTGGVAT